MNKIINPFTSLLPHLDLHGETFDTMKFKIDEFVKDNYKMGKEKIVIIHGRSGNVLKKETPNCLKKNKLVKKYYIDSFNDGQTIVELINRD